MPREMKVWGWDGFIKGRQHRFVVAAPTLIAVYRAAEAAGLDKPRRDYLCETSNETEVEVATAQPGSVFSVDFRERYGNNPVYTRMREPDPSEVEDV